MRLAIFSVMLQSLRSINLLSVSLNPNKVLSVFFCFSKNYVYIQLLSKTKDDLYACLFANADEQYYDIMKHYHHLFLENKAHFVVHGLRRLSVNKPLLFKVNLSCYAFLYTNWNIHRSLICLLKWMNYALWPSYYEYIFNLFVTSSVKISSECPLNFVNSFQDYIKAVLFFSSHLSY